MMCIGFGEETANNEIPEFGFFVPTKVFDNYVFRNPTTGDPLSPQPPAIVTNILKKCDYIPKIDFKLWKDTNYY
jgi:hypothetical protein